ncbi:Protein FAR1-RELATED SEQUENCE 6, partial [Ananas comosus]
TSNYAKEVSLGSSATYFDKEHGESGFSGEAASGDDEGSENMLADSPTEEPIAEKKAASLGGNNNAELDGIQITLGEDGKIPKVGMVYALHEGFGVAVKKSSFTSYGLCRRLVLVCTRGGKGRANACYQSRPTAKTNCQAIVIAKLWGDGLLHLIEANLEHNHALNPSSARFLRCHRKMSGYVNKDLLKRGVSKFHLEEQLSKIYTLNIFKKFQDELKATVHCQVSLLKMDGSTSTFEVKDSDFTEGGSNMGRKSYKVVYDVIESEVQCYCGYFQFHGILCRHALSVFKFQQVHEIPSHYVLNRWRKNCKLLHASNHPLKDVVTNNQMERYDHLSMRCLRLVEISATSDQKYQFVMKLVSEVRKSLLDDKTCRELQQRLSPIARSAENGEDHFTSKMVVFDGKNNSNSLPAKRRGRPPKRRKETDAEAMLSQSSIGRSLLAFVEGELDPSMVPSDRSQNGAPHSSSIASHLGSNIRTNGGFDPMEEVNPNHLSFGSHFGLNANHQLHLGTQLHSGNTLQVLTSVWPTSSWKSIKDAVDISTNASGRAYTFWPEDRVLRKSLKVATRRRHLDHAALNIGLKSPRQPLSSSILFSQAQSNLKENVGCFRSHSRRRLFKIKHVTVDVGVGQQCPQISEE